MPLAMRRASPEVSRLYEADALKVVTAMNIGERHALGVTDDERSTASRWTVQGGGKRRWDHLTIIVGVNHGQFNCYSG